MKGLKQRLKRPPTHVTPAKDSGWTRQDQRVWQAVAGNQPTKVATKLTKHPDVDVNKICPNVGYSVVHYAAAKGLDDCLNILLTHRADAASRDITGATPLHAAARYGHKGTTSKLLASRSVNVNLADKNDCTALHFASFEGHVECVKLIADTLDADLHCRDKDGRTPLMVAAAMGNLDVCNELLDRDANVHNRDSTLGHTALTLAADSGHADVVRLLCEHGARLSMALYDGRSALKLAKDRDRKSVVDALHIAQLTEAANKAPNGPRLSTSSSKQKSSDPTPAQKKRHSVDSILDNRQQQIHIDDLVGGTHLSSGSRTPKATRRTKEEKKPSKSNIARVKAAVGSKMKTNSRRGSDASGLSSASTPRQNTKHDGGSTAKASPASNRLSLYAEGDSSHFYDKEMKFYDTSLSNSSLDVSSTGSAMNNISKSMDSLRPTPEEHNHPYETPTAVHPVKVEGTDFAARPGNVETLKYQKTAAADYERRIKELEAQLSRANEVSAATEKLQKNAEEIRTAQIAAEKEEHTKNQAKMQEQLERMRQTSVGFEKQNKELLRRLGAAQQMVASTEALKEQLEKARDEINVLSGERESLKQNVQNLESQNDEMKSVVAKEKENESTIITLAKQKVIEAEHRCNQAEQRCAEAEQKGDQAEQKCADLERRLKESEGKCNELEQKCNEVERQLTEAKKKCNDAEHKCSQAKQSKEHWEENLARIEGEKDSFENQLKNLKVSSKQDTEELDRHRNEVSEIMQMLWEANNSEPAEPVDVRDVKAQVQILVEKLKVEEDLLVNAGSDKKVLEDKLNNHLDERNTKIKELEDRVKQQEGVLSQKTVECTHLEVKLEEAQRLRAESESRLRHLEKNLGEEVIRNRSEIAKVRAERQARTDEFDRSCDEVANLKKQLDEALDTMEGMRKESVSRKVYDLDKEKWEEDTGTMKRELSELLAKIAGIQLDIANKEQEISDLRVERNQSEAKATKFETEATTLKTKCHETEVQVNVLRQQLTDAKHKAEKVSEENENLRKSRRDMTLRLSTKQGEMSEAERKKVDGLRRQLEHLCKHLQESERRYKETISIYRGHLLAAVKGELDSDVLAALQEILKLRGGEEEKGQGSHI